MSDHDFKFIGGEFTNTYLPPELSYLHKYFKSELGKVFVAYYLAFSDLIVAYNIKFFIDNFVDHTGFYCSQQRLRYLLKRLQCLLEVTKQAELDLNFDQLDKIKSGKYKLV